MTLGFNSLLEWLTEFREIISLLLAAFYKGCSLGTAKWKKGIGHGRGWGLHGASVYSSARCFILWVSAVCSSPQLSEHQRSGVLTEMLSHRSDWSLTHLQFLSPLPRGWGDGAGSSRLLIKPWSLLQPGPILQLHNSHLTETKMLQNPGDSKGLRSFCVLYQGQRPKIGTEHFSCRLCHSGNLKHFRSSVSITGDKDQSIFLTIYSFSPIFWIQIYLSL